jgi:hypothetical protein
LFDSPCPFGGDGGGSVGGGSLWFCIGVVGVIASDVGGRCLCVWSYVVGVVWLCSSGCVWAGGTVVGGFVRVAAVRGGGGMLGGRHSSHAEVRARLRVWPIVGVGVIPPGGSIGMWGFSVAACVVPCVWSRSIV